MFEANDYQYTALKKAQEAFGRAWKGKLRQCWESSRYPASLVPYRAELQQVRNQAGASWLSQFRFEA